MDNFNSKLKCLMLVFFIFYSLIWIDYLFSENIEQNKNKIEDIESNNKKQLLMSLYAISRAIELVPENPSTRVNRALIYFELEEYDKAIMDLDISIALFPHERAFLVRGKIYMMKKQLQKAKNDFQKVLRFNPVNYTGYFYLGSIDFALGNTKQALDSFNASLKINPNFKWSLFQRSKIYSTLGEIEKFNKDIDQLLKIDPNFIDTMLRD